MRQLKCDNCGGKIEIEDETSEYATCPFCKAKYQLNERKDIYIRMDDNTKEVLSNSFNIFKKSSKLVLIPAIIVFILIIIVFITIFTNIISRNRKTQENTTNKTNQTNIMEEVKEKLNKSMFNSNFESRTGTKSKFLTEPLLDDVVTNNKTNEDMLITVVYKDTETTDPDTIIKIKHSLEDNKEYEIKLDYNKNGYVNKLIIEDI